MAKLTGSVGKAGRNLADDVKIVQGLLNQNLARIPPLKACQVSGTCDAQTLALIDAFQRRVVGMAVPDGRIDPGGGTFAALAGGKTPNHPGATQAAPAAEPTLTGNALPAEAARVLKEVMKSAGVPGARITSVSRTPAEQARVMYENCVSKGAAFNKKMYANAGDQVIDVYTANKGKPRDKVIALMLAKIEAVGPDKVSKHISDTHYTFDVAPSSIPSAQHAGFLKALRAHKSVSNVIPPPTDPAFHIEIPKK